VPERALAANGRSNQPGRSKQQMAQRRESLRAAPATWEVWEGEDGRGGEVKRREQQHGSLAMCSGCPAVAV
jgi:hypothetical protein